jgi:hypothetical protein
MSALCSICRQIIVKKDKLEDAKGVPRSRKSKKDRQYNGQKKRTNDDLQNISQKNKDRVTRTPLTTGGELRCSLALVFSH